MVRPRAINGITQTASEQSMGGNWQGTGLIRVREAAGMRLSHQRANQKFEKQPQTPSRAPIPDAGQPVEAFLRECGLEMYVEQLIEIGFDEMETLHDIEERDTRELGIPPYLSVHLLKRLRSLRNMDDASAVHSDNPVACFLEDRGLGQYAAVLLSSGFDEMDTLLDIEDADMKDLGVPRGHALKLRRHLREYQLEAYAAEAPAENLQTQTRRSSRVKGSAQIAVAQFKRPQKVPQKALVAPVSIRQPSVTLQATDKMKGDVEKSWEKVQEVGTSVVGELLYRYTFELAPVAMGLFPAHVRMKYREWTSEEGDEDETSLLASAALRKLFAKVLNAVGCAVSGIHDTSKLVPMLTKLGARHIGYGVPESYWEVLGKALNMTLREILGPGFTAEVEKAWAVVYGFMSSIMIQGLRQAREREAEAPALLCESTSSELSAESTKLPTIDADMTSYSVDIEHS